MLSVKNITKTYKNGKHYVHALENVDIHFNVGDFTFVLGESGSGKSTLLNILTGLDDATSGSIEIDGVDTTKFTKKDWAIYRNHYVGFVFQEYNLIDHLSVVENIELPLLFQGATKKVAREKALEKLNLVGLSKFNKKYPRQLSGGQQQRVSIARALVTDPKIIMADEPTGALDSDLSHKIISFLKKVSKDKVVVIVTHDEDLAGQYAERIIRLEDGKVVDDTYPQEPLSSVKKELVFHHPKMRLGMIFKFAKNNVTSRMFRSLFSSSIVSIGYIAIFLLSFLIIGINTSISDSLETLFPEDLYHIYHIENIDLTNEEMAELKDLDEIEEIRYEINQPINFASSTYVDASANLISIPYDTSVYIADETLFGTLPSEDNEILINVSVAELIRGSFNIDEDSYGYLFALVEGREITLYTSLYNENEQIILEQGDYKIVGMVVDGSYSPQIYIEYEKLLILSDEINDDDSIYRSMAKAYLSISKENDIDDFQLILKDDYDLVLENVFESITSDVEDFMMQALKVFVAIASVTVLVSGILIGLVIYTSILERIKEIGILTAIGAKEGNIVAIFIIESSIIGMLSSIIAIILALLLSRGINGLFNSFIESPINLLTGGSMDMTLITPNIYVIIIVIVFSIGYSMLAGLIPSLKSAHLNAIQALRKE